ncbi:carboxylesterase [Penicillium malachiteum]|uniref:carboxylesterase n=1 Tax=Penicillium malachiteum TaxID=1324776 RepID=UPI002548A487|nr:carboxylesterase [Penicillium malachiteum]KAJ5735591.1 carboxylesterase [Penicillium malachiteum]
MRAVWFFVPLSLAQFVLASLAGPVVNTSYGQVQGAVSQYRKDVNVFRGMPYASPPTGENRFKAPQEPQAWHGIRNATVFGPQCVQISSSASIFTTGSTVMSEDCLSINVWAPSNATSKSKLPVYFWIYGGRYFEGSGDVPTYDGSNMASKDIIVVTFNYRLGILGYFAHPELSAESMHNSSGNYGMLDMVAALEWTHKNIASFGGDPEHITVGGQSAGSCGALDMMLSPLAEGLGVVGIISETGARGTHDPSMAGSSTSYRQKTDAESYGVTFLEDTLNLTSIEELRQVPYTTLVEYYPLNGDYYESTPLANISAFMEPPIWRPVLDGYAMPYSYSDALKYNAHKDVPILTGNNADESGAQVTQSYNVSTYNTTFGEMYGNMADEFFKLFPATGNTSDVTEVVNAMYRSLSRVGTWTWALDWHKGGAKSDIYTYYWTHAPPIGGQGAYHGSELYYAFGVIPYVDSSASWTETDYAVQKKMSSYWANFIKTGNPNGRDLPFWSPSQNATKTMWLGNSWGNDEIAASTERVQFILDYYKTLPAW